MSESEEVHLRCYRGACNAPADPRCWNRTTCGLYCLKCAREIDSYTTADTPGGSLFPYMNHPKPPLNTSGRRWPAIMVRKAQVEEPKDPRLNPSEEQISWRIDQGLRTGRAARRKAARKMKK